MSFTLDFLRFYFLKAESSKNIPTGCVSTGALLSHNAPQPANGQWCTSGRRRSRRRGVVWIGPAGVVLCYIIAGEPSCAVLLSPWVKWCQPSRLMCPPALIRGGSELAHRSMGRLTPNRHVVDVYQRQIDMGKTWNGSADIFLPVLCCHGSGVVVLSETLECNDNAGFQQR